MGAGSAQRLCDRILVQINLFEKVATPSFLVVLDIRMPGMDGIAALNAILGKNRRVPVILNTAYPQYKENFMTWGAEAYVVKSSGLTELKQIKKRSSREFSREYSRRHKIPAKKGEYKIRSRPNSDYSQSWKAMKPEKLREGLFKIIKI